jgi:predicted dehydrogenase
MLKVGLIGSGRKAEQQLDLLSKTPDIQLSGITDESFQDDARRLAGEYGIPWIEQTEQLIQQSDILDITCSGVYAFTSSVAAVKNFRHVYLHTGLSWDLEDIRLLSRLSLEAGVKVCVQNLKRTNRTFIAARKYTVNPQFIEINLAESGSPGSEEALSYRLCQCVDLLMAVNSDTIRRIQAHAVPMKDQSIGFLQSRFEYNNGCVATISYSRINGKPSDILSTYSEEGSLKVDFLNGIASFIPYPCTARQTVTGDAIQELNIAQAIRQIINPTPGGTVLSTINDLLLPQEITRKILEKARIQLFHI